MAPAPWKQKVAHEALEYGINFAYLAFFFLSFAWYRKLVLAEHEIGSVDFGVALVESLILAKVILIGNALHLGRRVEGKPLIFPTLYKTVIFSLFCGAFTVIEHSLSGLLHGQGWSYGVHEILNLGRDKLVSRCLVMLIAFIPFFAFQELGMTLGEGKIWALFFHRPPARKPAQDSTIKNKS